MGKRTVIRIVSSFIVSNISQQLQIDISMATTNNDIKNSHCFDRHMLELLIVQVLNLQFINQQAKNIIA